MRHFDTSSFRQNIYEKPFGIYQIRLKMLNLSASQFYLRLSSFSIT